MPQTPAYQQRVVLSVPARRPEVESGEDLCGWRREDLIGEDHCAQLFAARPLEDTSNQAALYALKTLKREWQDDEHAVRVLRHEAWIGQHVAHPHLAPVLAVNVAQQPYFLVMPRLGGQSLAALIASGQGPALPLALWVARQAAEGLVALADAGWLHGAMQPASIFVSPEMHVTLLDLGYAQRSGEPSRIAERPALDAAPYLAPEMFSSSTLVDNRSDIYSLGAILFEMLADRPPFESADRQALARRHREELPGGLRRLALGTPAPVARLVQQMLAKNPLRRPQSPQEVVDRLAALEIETFAEHLA